ncbi:MAG TPA: NADPH-dependent FMN reductase [Rhodanobacteraceae bacterium]|nr:NADPH-dependent FMN reductase [Rhodanobacteraceae bacterium]
MTDVAVLVGSLRRGSYSRQLAHALIELAPPSLTPSLVGIGELPLYNPDLDDDTPPSAWQSFRERMQRAEAFLLVTPEYNRSVPAALKNALDVGSRPYGHSVWGDKPGAIVSNSPGAISGFGANHHLRQSMVFLNVLTMMQPEAYLGGVDKLFDADGKLVNDGTREFLGNYMQAFADWIARTRAK